MANVIGPDVSFYQDDPETPQGIDFVKMAATAGFVIIRAGQNLWVDSDFKLNWREAKLAGLPRGSYWFYDSRAEPKRQAELWVQQFEGDFGELPLFADFEEDYGGIYKGWRNWYTFLERLKQLVSGHEICIYTAYYYWRDHAPSGIISPSNLEYFHQYPLWIANYGVNQPTIPRPWKSTEWLFWQYTEAGDGKLFGVESNGIDLNYFNGDKQALKERFHIPDVITPPPPPPGGGGTPTGRMYKVTASALKVREGPGLAYNSVGLLYFDETVEEIGAITDRTWLRVRRADGGLQGWCFSAYLQSLDAPPPDDEEPPIPIPEDQFKNWYRVNTASLPIRENPNTRSKVLGTFGQDDSIGAVDDTTNPAWIQIRRLNGLTGWCEKKFLSLRGPTRPTSYRQRLFNGVSYTRREMTDVRKVVVHALGIDLQTEGLDFLVTPPSTEDGILCTRTTSKFLKEFGANIAINGDGFTYLDPLTAPPNLCAEGDPVRPNGYAVSRRKVYSSRKTADPTVYINQRNQVTINESKGQVVNAVSGDRMVVEKGKPVKNLAATVPNPRTAIGLNKTGRMLTLVVVDGREEGQSEGMTFPELANLMISFGCHTAANMDGGGSSTMVIRGIDGQPRVVNRPVDANTPGREREAANHLGIFLKNG